MQLEELERAIGQMAIRFEMLPSLHSALRGIHLRHPCFGPAVRLAKRWVHSQMFSDHLSDEAVEIIMSRWVVVPLAASRLICLPLRLFVQPEPYSVPHSALFRGQI